VEEAAIARSAEVLAAVASSAEAQADATAIVAVAVEAAAEAETVPPVEPAKRIAHIQTWTGLAAKCQQHIFSGEVVIVQDQATRPPGDLVRRTPCGDLDGWTMGAE
jgi:hypothetical protein